MGTHPIFESDFDCLTDLKMADSRDEKVDLNENEMMEQQSLMKDGPEKKSTSSFVGTWADWDKVNFFLAIFNLMNAILGSGILGLAYAVKSLGILLYIVMLMVVAGLAFYARWNGSPSPSAPPTPSRPWSLHSNATPPSSRSMPSLNNRPSRKCSTYRPSPLDLCSLCTCWPRSLDI